MTERALYFTPETIRAAESVGIPAVEVPNVLLEAIRKVRNKRGRNPAGAGVLLKHDLHLRLKKVAKANSIPTNRALSLAVEAYLAEWEPKIEADEGVSMDALRKRASL